jgi:lysozyme
MDISQRGIDLIVGSEGKHKLLPDGRYKAYLDTLADPPVWTIYKGLTKGVHEGMIITEAEGERMFNKELAVYEDAIERLVKVPLNQNQFDALVSFVYNVGPGQKGFAGSTLLKLLNQGKYDQCPAQFKRWHFAGGISYGGLVTRRAKEAALFMMPSDDRLAETSRESEVDDVPVMPQRVEEAPVGSAKDAIKTSWTIKGALIAFLATVSETAVEAYSWLTGVARDAGTELTALKQVTGPFDTILVTMKSALPVLAVVGIVIVVSRRTSAAREGKIG